MNDLKNRLFDLTLGVGFVLTTGSIAGMAAYTLLKAVLL